MLYSIYIKSHTDYPDFEQEIEAVNEAEAIERFYQMLRGEFDREFIRRHLLSN
jgi:ribosomal protein L20A (L18A)